MTGPFDMAAEVDAAALEAACREVDRLDHLQRTLLLAWLLPQPGQASRVLEALTTMRDRGQLPGPALTLHQGGQS